MMAEPTLAIGAVARLTGMPIKTIRYYGDIGLLPPTEVTDAGYRRYGAEAVWRLELIRALRQMEFGIEEIRQILAGSRAVGDAIDLHLEALSLHIEQLTRIRDLVSSLKDRGQAGQVTLADLHRLGQVLTSNDAQRQKWFERAIRALLLDPTAPEAWQRQFMEGFTALLPAEPSAD